MRCWLAPSAFVVKGCPTESSTALRNPATFDVGGINRRTGRPGADLIRARDYTCYLRATEDYYVNATYTKNCTLDKMADIIEVSKKRSSFLTKYF